MMASPAVSTISKMSNDELRRLTQDELIRLLRKSEGDRLQLLAEHNNLMKDVNKKMQVHLLEIRGLKEVNGRLQQDNQELRDLCCFLDDDRQKRSKMAREWQRFGRYTSSVMKSEVSTYQQKLKELESKQEEMLRENLELKELCLYLDNERGNGEGGGGIGIDGQRDQGDGSSNSTSDGQTDAASNGRQQRMEEALVRQKGALNEQTLKYIRSLEQQINEMEMDKQTVAKRLEPSGAEVQAGSSTVAPNFSQSQHQFRTSQAPLVAPSASQSQYRNRFFSTPQINAGTGGGSRRGSQENLLNSTPTGRTVYGAEENKAQPPIPQYTRATTPVSKPEAVVHAMKVLEVHEQLESASHAAAGAPEGDMEQEEDMDDTEKALLREMCNVVWRKLEEGTEER